MTNWKETTLGEVAEVNELSIDRNFEHEFIEYIDIASVGTREIGNVQEMKLSEAPSRARRLVRDNDILISTVRPNLKHFCYIKKSKPNLVASTGFAVVSAKKADPRFLYYLLTTNEYCNYLTKVADSQTSTYPAFNPGVIVQSKFLLPPIEKQKEVAGILGSLDDKIELLWEENKTLEATAQAIFKRWFVDFEFPADSASRNQAGEPVAEGKPYKSSGGKMIDSESGLIPDGWRVGRLSEIATFLNGLALQKYPPESEVEYLPVIKIKELNSGISEQTDRASARLDSKYIVENGDILFSWSGSLIVDVWKYGRGALNQHLFRVTSDKFPKWFYFYWIKEHLPNFQQTATAKAVTMGHIQRHHLDDALVVIPNEDFMRTADNVSSPMLEKFINNNSQIQTLSTLRDILLLKLMNREIRL